MSDKKDTTHVLIDKQLVIFLRPRSAVWQCRYQVDKRWQRESTGEHDLDKATKRAHDLLIEANVRKKLNVAPITRYFKALQGAMSLIASQWSASKVTSYQSLNLCRNSTT
jgi:hypothetical protein